MVKPEWRLKWRRTEKDIVIAHGNWALYIEPEEVDRASEFAGHFREGQRIARLQLISGEANLEKKENIRQVAELLRRFHLNLPRLKDKFALKGFYGDTSNTALLNSSKKRGALIIKSPAYDRIQAKVKYVGNMLRDSDYPRRYALKKVHRIILK